MMNMWEIISQTFFQNAIYAGMLSAIICGIIGSFVVVRKLVFLIGGISHSSFGGLGLGKMLKINPFVGAFIFSIFSAFSIDYIKNKFSINQDSVIGAVWAIGMAIGIIALHFTPGYTGNLESYLFGNILMVGSTDLMLLLILDFILVAIIYLFYDQFLSISYDLEFSKAQGLNVNFFNNLLLVLISISVVLLIKIFGIILVISMLTIPSSIALLFTKRFKDLLILSSIASFSLILIGLFVSYILEIPTSASIVLLSALIYVSLYYLKKVIK